MKIAILTHPLRTNYGGILQNYALQKYLIKLGCEPCTLELPVLPSINIWKYPLVIIKRIILRIFMNRKDIIVFYEKRYKRDYEVFTQFTRHFVSEYIKTLAIENFEKDINSSSFDAYIVGSDQVWRVGNMLYHYFLDFTSMWDVKRISYASSFGLDYWNYTKLQTKKCAYLAQQFDAISVREDSGLTLCKEFLNVDSVQMPDPTFLLAKGDYVSLINRSRTHKTEGNLFVHFLDNNKQKEMIISNIVSKYGVTPFKVNQKEHEEDLSKPIEQRIQPPVEQWLQAFEDADYVLTDSFHATVFSIIFNKSFRVISNQERGLTRIKSLLRLFDLEKCLVTVDNKEIEFFDIDYEPVKLKIDNLRAEADNYLRCNLSIM